MLALPASALRCVAPLAPAVRRRYLHAHDRFARTQASVAVRAYAAKASKDTKRFDFTRKFKTHKCELPDNFCVTSKDELNKMFDQMAAMRRLEIVADNEYKAKTIRGFCHLYIGQEAIAVGMEAAITKDDHIITAYREHCQMLGRGASYESILGELLGKKSGCSLGKGGSMHMFAHNFYGGNGIVGAQVPLGAGIALAQKVLGKNVATIAMYGDGAANQGQVFEAFNMSRLWNLPVIYVCENNKYGMGTSAERAAASPAFYTRGDYLPGVWADGMDVLASKVAFAYCRQHVTSGKGPIVLEMDTYRYRGHSMSDPGKSYRNEAEVTHVQNTLDCIELTRKRLTEAGWATEAELEEREAKIRADIDAACAKVKGDTELPTQDLYTHIYCTPTYHTVRAVEYKDSLFQ